MSGKLKSDLFGNLHLVSSDEPNVQNDNTELATPPPLNSSKEIFARPNPNFQQVSVELTTSFANFTVPDDLFTNLAEALNIKGRTDIFSIELLLTVSKLRPLLAKKLNIKWSTIEKDIIRPLIRKHRSDHYSTSLFTIDSVPQGQWFYGDEPLSSGMDILLAARRINCEITYDEWFDVCRINYKGETLLSMKLDDIHYLLTKEFTYHFKFRIEKRHTMDALGVLRRDPSRVFNSRLDWLDSFAAPYDPQLRVAERMC
jgi:hypothetical protein